MTKITVTFELKEVTTMRSQDTRPGDADRLAYSVNDACRLLSIGRTSLYELVKNGELKLIRIAGRTLVPRSEIERLTSIDRAA